jgi:uncharacterized membrane protein YoaK (UPF0700 family)
LAGEVVLLAGVAAGWAATGGQPGAGTASLLLVLASAAMGVQSTVTISSGVRGASTTHLTGTFTEAVRSLAMHPHRIAPVNGAAVRLAALLGGAVLGALVVRVAPPIAAAVPVALVGVVVATVLPYPSP